MSTKQNVYSSWCSDYQTISTEVRPLTKDLLKTEKSPEIVEVITGRLHKHLTAWKKLLNERAASLPPPSRTAVTVGTGKSFKKWNSRLLPTKFPGCESHEFGSDTYWACAARHLTTNLHHQVGTCKMGPSSDSDAVVDPRLRVYGIQNLRVVDGSIMPIIPASHTNAVVVMIGEKAADLIKEDWKNQ